MQKAFLWRGVASKRPGHVWLLLRKPREAEVEGGDWGAFLFEVNSEGKQNQKKRLQGGRPGRLPLHVLLRLPRERRKQSCVRGALQFKVFSKECRNEKMSASGWGRKQRLLPNNPPNAQKRGAKRFPPPSPDPSQDLREGGSVRGKPIGTNFGSPMTINDPPACAGPWAPQGEPKTLRKLGGGNGVNEKPNFAPMGLPRTPPPSRRARHEAEACHSHPGPLNYAMCCKGAPFQLSLQPYK